MAVAIVNNHSTINLIDLDPNAIKSSLINFLRTNDQFKDYDFEASNINLLIDLLAVNGHRQAFYQNMALNEAFLDSALLRNSALSRAKELNYVPRSARSSKARVRIEFEATSDSAPYVVPKGSPLTTLVKNQSYTYTIPENITVASANNTYIFETDIYEGVYVQDSYTMPVDGTLTRFQLTNRNIDTTSLVVTVFEDGNEVGDAYIRSDSLLDLKSTSKVFFLQTSMNGYYEVLFGDNNIGRRPKTNATIVLNYRVSSGKVSNGAREFTLDFDPTGTDELSSTAIVSTLQSSQDGADIESLESIKYMAPRHFQVQERAVTSSDFEVALKARFPEINAVFAYGGEELSPAQYGKVFVAVDLQNVDSLPDSKIQEYTTFLKNRTTFGIVPVFVEPEYSYLQVNTRVRYNLNITSATKETVRTYVKDAIIGYRNDNLDDFNTILRHSKLEKAIDEADSSIISTFTETLVYKKIVPQLNTIQDYRLQFGIPLRTDIPSNASSHDKEKIAVLQSSVFVYNSEFATLEDDGNGIVRIIRESGDTHAKIIDIGTICYITGCVKLRNFKVDSYRGDSIRIYVRPKDVDVNAKLNNILTIEPDEINIELEQLRV